MKKRHELKTWPPYWADIDANAKMFELRKDDRNFQVGDILLLREYDPKVGYSGRECKRKVIYKLTDKFSGIQQGYCVLGILPLPLASGMEFHENELDPILD